MQRLLVMLVVASTLVARVSAAPHPPLKQHGGIWPAGHVQGIAVDVNGGFI